MWCKLSSPLKIWHKMKMKHDTLSYICRLQWTCPGHFKFFNSHSFSLLLVYCKNVVSSTPLSLHTGVTLLSLTLPQSPTRRISSIVPNVYDKNTVLTYHMTPRLSYLRLKERRVLCDLLFVAPNNRWSFKIVCSPTNATKLASESVCSARQ